MLATRRSPPPNVFGPDRVDSAAFTEWRAQALHLLTGLLGSDAVYVQRFASDVTAATPGNVNEGLGTLRAVREDAEHGDLVDLRTLVAGEVFSDFLDMARHLLGNKYPVAAASIAGAVLEDGLRRIAAARGVELKPMDGAGAISSRLAIAKVHSSLEQKQLGMAIGVRDDADHGHFDRVGDSEAREMLRVVEAYLAAHLTSVS